MADFIPPELDPSKRLSFDAKDYVNRFNEEFEATNAALGRQSGLFELVRKQLETPPSILDGLKGISLSDACFPELPNSEPIVPKLPNIPTNPIPELLSTGFETQTDLTRQLLTVNIALRQDMLALRQEQSKMTDQLRGMSTETILFLTIATATLIVAVFFGVASL